MDRGNWQAIVHGVAKWKRVRLQCGRPGFDSWVGKVPWRRDRLPTPVFLGFSDDSDSKEFTCNVGDIVRKNLLEEGMASPLQYSCLENPHRQRSLVGYSLWGHKESDTIEQLSTCRQGKGSLNPETRHDCSGRIIFTQHYT